MEEGGGVLRDSWLLATSLSEKWVATWGIP